MGLRPTLPATAVLLLVAGAPRADVAEELSDFAARIDYGFYAGDAVIIEGAREALEAMAGSDPLVDYYRAYAGLRLAQIDARGSRRDDALEACVDYAESAARDGTLSAEAWVLVAACSRLAAEASPLTGAFHERKRKQALDRARQEDPDNPRLLLVASLPSLEDRGDEDTADQAGLESTLAAFEAWPHPFDLPDWGEAETLAALGAERLRQGDVRGARDYIERALLIAPDYAFALSLQRRLRQP